MALKLIGAGLGRTGTLSLKLALERLGYGPCYHMAELLMDAARAPSWVRAADGQSDWESIFFGYAATVDYPGCTFWRELAEFYPSAKVLLTVRDADRWFDSTQKTIFSATMTTPLSATLLKEFFDKTVWKDFGDRIHDRQFMVAAFRQHNAAVERAIPKDRLLVYEVEQGWTPLCEFLGVPVPGAPFPCVNTSEEYQQRRIPHAEGADVPALDIEKMGQMVREGLAHMRVKD